MSDSRSVSRRALLQRFALTASLVPLATGLTRTAFAANPLLTTEDPQAKALQYTEDAKTAKAAKPGSQCGSCALYQGAKGSAQGPCQIFPGKDVKATGWCMSWAAQT